MGVVVVVVVIVDVSHSTEGWLIGVSDVEEAVWVLPLLVDLGHEGVALQDVPSIDEEVERVFLGESDSLPDNEAELIGGEVARGQVSTDKDSVVN